MAAVATNPVTFKAGQLFCDVDVDKSHSTFYNFAKWSARVLEGQHLDITKWVVETLFKLGMLFVGKDSKADLAAYNKNCRVEYALLDAFKVENWQELEGLNNPKNHGSAINVEFKDSRIGLIPDCQRITQYHTETQTHIMTLAYENKQWCLTHSSNKQDFPNFLTADGLLNSDIKKVFKEMSTKEGYVYKKGEDQGQITRAYRFDSWRVTN